MIIKSKSIKKKSKKALENTIRYILTKESQKQVGFIMNRYIKGDRNFDKQMQLADKDLLKQEQILEKRIQNMVKQFESNESKRKIERSNANIAYHEIISFHKSDTDKLPKKVLLKIARKYAKERSPNSMIISSMHSDKSHLHIHNVISALEFATGKPVRLTRKEFKDVKIRMEYFQQQELGLEFSKVDHSKKKVQMLQLDIDRELNLRGKRSERQEIQSKLIQVFAKVRTEKVYYRELEKAGLELYSRGGKIVGVQGFNKRYRLKTLGFDPKRISLEKVQENIRLKDLQKLKSNKNQELEQ
ncbi:relaxase/mobilization nuclease domain-containing protein [Polaribacter cellanae]|uniref:Relaxase/mobilization nuclease domain-containing protein n=1 Tax=Polaribacter cellanae TaxID=2818493 RepID=A0A975CQ14_9FLAO|nr:relaxase/mobilization nuclease domain-containing protein [Polaribacter cellanae]QTE21086.1 relaxase/mobilization nuclease domain-containing protein [Polaribacter cellanae]